jgi:hypothetical protein
MDGRAAVLQQLMPSNCLWQHLKKLVRLGKTPLERGFLATISGIIVADNVQTGTAAGVDDYGEPYKPGGRFIVPSEIGSIQTTFQFNSGSPETRPVNTAVRYLIRALP